MLRDWRRRGFLDSIGATWDDSNRRFYSLTEVVELALVRVLEPNGQPIQLLLYMANRLSLGVLDAFRVEKEFEAFTAPIWGFGIAKGGLDTKTASVKNYADLEHYPFDDCQLLVVDIKKLIDELPLDLKVMLAGAGGG